jgi:hypothetical protein
MTAVPVITVSLRRIALKRCPIALTERTFPPVNEPPSLGTASAGSQRTRMLAARAVQVWIGQACASLSKVSLRPGRIMGAYVTFTQAGANLSLTRRRLSCCNCSLMKRTGASYARLNRHVEARQSKSRSSRVKPRHDQDCEHDVWRYFHAVMGSWKKPDPELLPVHRPLCPKCQKRMTTTAVSDGPEGFATTLSTRCRS